MSNIYLDIETIPSQEPWAKDMIDVSPPKTIKKKETLDKWHEEIYPLELEKALSKTGLDGLTNHIICIGFAIDDEEPITIYAHDYKEEFNLLNQFYYHLSKNADQFGNIFIGHNVLSFDLGIIKKRSIILGVKPEFKLPYDAKPWSDSVYDTMLRWDSKSFTSQDKICQALGIEGKGDMDGSKVYQYWKDGRHDEIQTYCQSDVKTVRNIYKRMSCVC